MNSSTLTNEQILTQHLTITQKLKTLPILLLFKPLLPKILDVQTINVHNRAAQTNTLTFLMLSLLSKSTLTIKNGLVLRIQ